MHTSKVKVIINTYTHRERPNILFLPELRRDEGKLSLSTPDHAVIFWGLQCPPSRKRRRRKERKRNLSHLSIIDGLNMFGCLKEDLVN